MANVVNLYGSAASIPLDELSSMSKAQLVQCATILHSALTNANKQKFAFERELQLQRSSDAGAPAAERQHVCDLEGKCAAMEQSMKSAQEAVRRVASENGNLKRLLSLSNVGPGANQDAWVQVESEAVPVPAALSPRTSPILAAASTEGSGVQLPPSSPILPPSHHQHQQQFESPASNGSSSNNNAHGDEHNVGPRVISVGSSSIASPTSPQQPSSGTFGPSSSGQQATTMMGSSPVPLQEERSRNSDSGSLLQKENSGAASIAESEGAAAAAAAARTQTPPSPPKVEHKLTVCESGRNTSVTNVYKELQGSRSRIASLEDEVARLKGEVHEQARVLRLRESTDEQYLKKMNAALTKQAQTDRERILSLQHEVGSLRHELRRIEQEEEARAIELMLGDHDDGGSESGGETSSAPAVAAAASGGGRDEGGKDLFEAAAARAARLRKSKGGESPRGGKRRGSAAALSSNIIQTEFVEAETQTESHMLKLLEVCRKQGEELRDVRLELHATTEQLARAQEQLKLARRDADDLRKDAEKSKLLVGEMQQQLRWERTQKAKQQLDAPIGGTFSATARQSDASSNVARRASSAGVSSFL